MTIILTGFEPFDGAESNSSWDAVSLIDDMPGLVTARLPVEFGRAWHELDALIEQHSPDLVIAVGLAADRTAITPERVAINLADARIADNAGNQPRDSQIADGPDAFFSRLPVTAIVERIRGEGIAAEVSLSAGAFVCNDLMYRMLANTDGATPVGFIHVPSAQTMPIDTIARGLRLAVEVCLSARAEGKIRR